MNIFYLINTIISLLLFLIAVLTMIYKFGKQNQKQIDLELQVNEIEEKKSELEKQLKIIDTDIKLIQQEQRITNNNIMQLIEKQDIRIEKNEKILQELKEISIKHSFCNYYNPQLSKNEKIY